jgi:hypothetical protein
MNNAAYWIAVGVLALGLNSEYRQGNFVALHRIAQRADSLFGRITTRAEATLAVARFLTSREGAVTDTLVASSDEAEMARDRAEMLRERAQDQAEILRDGVRDRVLDEIRARADVMRARAEIRRAQIERVQLRARSRFGLANLGSRGVSGVCPKTGTRVVVNRRDEGAVLPEVEAEQTF